MEILKGATGAARYQLQVFNVPPPSRLLTLPASHMAYADALASSDPAEPDTDGLTPGVSDFEEPVSSRNHSLSRQSSLSRSMFSPSPSLGSVSSSDLGRRHREIGSQAWSTREKVHIQEFAADKCAEYELTTNERKDIMRDSEVSQFY